MTKNWWFLYGIAVILDLGTFLVLVILVLTNRLNMLGTVFLIIGHSGLCLMAIKSRLSLFRTHRLLGMALIDPLYEYIKCHIIGLLFPFLLAIVAFRLSWIERGATFLITGSLILMYLMCILSTYVTLRRHL